MTLRELYPYLSDTHDELIDLLAALTEQAWTNRLCLPATATVRQVVVRMIERERELILEVAQQRPRGSAALELSGMSGDDLLSELSANRAVTERYVATLRPEMLRAVRAVPADAERNVPESNMPLAWILWSVTENEIAAAARIRFLLDLANHS